MPAIGIGAPRTSAVVVPNSPLDGRTTGSTAVAPRPPDRGAQRATGAPHTPLPPRPPPPGPVAAQRDGGPAPADAAREADEDGAGPPRRRRAPVRGTGRNESIEDPTRSNRF